jgi:hypothetical protein
MHSTISTKNAFGRITNIPVRKKETERKTSSQNGWRNDECAQGTDCMEKKLAEILHLYNLTCAALLKRVEIFTSFCCQDSEQFWRMQLDFSLINFSCLKFSDIEKSEIRV